MGLPFSSNLKRTSCDEKLIAPFLKRSLRNFCARSFSNKIGLKSVQRIVQMHHGEIFIQDQGFYTVIIVLPTT